MNVNLVFEGGGVLGINYVGTMKALEERGCRAMRCAGTSAGSVVSALITAGYTSREMSYILHNTDFKMFMKRTKLGKVFLIGGLLSMIFDKGEYDSGIIAEWMEGLLKKKGVTKFKHVMLGGKSRLKIVAADITKRKMLILPDDLKDYGIDPMEFSISKAVEMSCAIPFYFTPIKLKYGNSTSYIVDGGLLSGYPIWIFDDDNPGRCPTLGIKIRDPDSFTSQGKTDLISYLRDVIDAPLNEDMENFIHHKDCVKTILISYDGKISPVDFDKVAPHMESLVKNGYDSTMRFFEKNNHSGSIRLVN